MYGARIQAEAFCDQYCELHRERSRSPLDACGTGPIRHLQNRRRICTSALKELRRDPPAPTPHETVYPRIGSLDSRVLVWFVTQQHTYFGGFVLALPLFCALLEFLGLITKKPALALRYDGLARDLAKVAVLALSVSAIIGSVMLTMFITLYPSFMKYMGGTFKGFMPAYAAVFVGEIAAADRLLLRLESDDRARHEVDPRLDRDSDQYCGHGIIGDGECMVRPS